ncbi:type I 3-dehydroquinate dehydratase [Lachnospiraceae bacterium OttesenSCG-928-E19]|nr:type I 3-dehydroquinate dehydratase [Lachnospiraceae bacterium OttesenSCG-928-E19]
MVTIRKIEIGSGMPKICVPIVEETDTNILEAAKAIVKTDVDIVEWRVDWYQDVETWGKVRGTASKLRQILGDLPLLFTFRTASEGGEKSIEQSMYIDLIQKIAETGYVDIIDIELFAGEEVVAKTIINVHQHGVKAIVSNHNFHQTPKVKEIVSRLMKMRELGADIPKIAVMPTSKKDVLDLLVATEEAAAKLDCPIITMSMNGDGVISRLCGEVFGSAMTFGTVGKPSAPGQICVEDLRTVLEVIHRSK